MGKDGQKVIACNKSVVICGRGQNKKRIDKLQSLIFLMHSVSSIRSALTKYLVNKLSVGV